MQSKASGGEPETRKVANEKTSRAKQRALLIAAPTADDPLGDDLSELHELLRTAGVGVVGELIQRRETPHPNTFLGTGKLNELEALIPETGANVVVCDDELSPRQERNLEAQLKIPVVDRTAVILDIFADHAHTAEGKLQVELAQLEYNLARMRGLWTHLERLGGGIGTRGPGESQIETDRRLARDRIAALRRRLRHLGNHRETIRAERERSSLPKIALAGYTNAGKSTLLNALCGSEEVSSRDRLFETLDPTTRTVEIRGRSFLVTDTVGFIRKLPHQLVTAFKTTLEETLQADLILNVVDASTDEASLPALVKAVDEVLQEIGAGDVPRLTVLNKLDAVDPERAALLRIRYRDAVAISAATGEGLDELGSRIEQEFRRTLQPMELLIPYSDGAKLAELHTLAAELERTDTPEGVRVRASVPHDVTHRYAQYLTSPLADGAKASEPA